MEADCLFDDRKAQTIEGIDSQKAMSRGQLQGLHLCSDLSMLYQPVLLTICRWGT